MPPARARRGAPSLAPAAVTAALALALSAAGASGRLETGEEKGQQYFSIQSGTVTAANLTAQLGDFHATAEGVPLWTIVLIPPDLSDESCHYNMIVPQLYPVTRDVQRYARAEMLRLVGEPAAGAGEELRRAYAEQEHLFNGVLGIPTPTQEEVGCMSILRYNAMVSDADLMGPASKEGDADLGAGADAGAGASSGPGDRARNPDLVRIPAGTRRIDRDTFIRFVLDSYAYKGMQISDVDALRAFGETYMPMGYVPVVMYLNSTGEPEAAGGGEGDGQRAPVGVRKDVQLSAQMWAALSSLTELNTVFAFGMTDNAALFNESIPEDDRGVKESPAFMAVIPRIGDAVVFPEPGLGDDLKLLSFTVETMDRPDRAAFEQAARRSAVAVAFVDHVHDFLTEISARIPTATRDKFIAAMQERARAGPAGGAAANATGADAAAGAGGGGEL